MIAIDPGIFAVSSGIQANHFISVGFLWFVQHSGSLLAGC